MPDASQPVPPPPPLSTPPGPPPFTVDIEAIKNDFVAVLTKPVEFWPTLRGRVGLGPPVIFAAAMGLAVGVIGAVFALAHVTYGGFGVVAALTVLILSPILYPLLGSFVGGAVVHVIQLIAGGKGTYETSVRIASYALAVAPIAAVLALVPLLSILPHLYGLYLIVLGILALHGADRQRTYIVVGILAALLLILDVSAWMTARAARNFVQEMGRLQRP